MLELVSDQLTKLLSLRGASSDPYFSLSPVLSLCNSAETLVSREGVEQKHLSFHTQNKGDVLCLLAWREAES